MTTPGHDSSAAPDKHDRTQPIERVVFFPDAVAIAMTLLILPLMESVSEAPEQGDTAVWLNAHSSQVLSFAMSFLLIAVFWMAHHGCSSGCSEARRCWCISTSAGCSPSSCCPW